MDVSNPAAPGEVGSYVTPGRAYGVAVVAGGRMTLIGLRPSWNIEALAFFFGVDQATVSRKARRVWNAFQKLGLASLGGPQPSRQGEGKNVEETWETFPDGLAIIDGTEPRLQRPQDPEAQRPHSSGRRKTLSAVDHRGYVRGASASAPGSPPDWSRTVESGMIRPIPEPIPVMGDAGFNGTPHPARRNPPERAHPGAIMTMDSTGVAARI